MSSAMATALEIDQTGRFLQIKTPLGPDAALLSELSGEDAISRPYVFQVEIATNEKQEAIRSLLGQPVTLFVGRDDSPGRRPVHGVVRRVSGYTVSHRGLRFWRLEIVPRLWFLSCVADCRIFQNKSVLDILQIIFQEHNVADFEIRASGEFPKMDYCVQYRETTLAFVSRLMEQFGLFYWHEHTESAHVLVVANANRSAKQASDTAVVLSGAAHAGDLTELSQDYTFRPGKWTMRDFDFTAPQRDLTASTPTLLTQPPALVKHEIYDYPGNYEEKNAGRDITKMHVEIEEAHFHRVHGSGSLSAFDAGRRCKAKGLSSNAREQEFLLTEVRHHALDHPESSNAKGAAQYGNEFSAVPIDVPYRHPTVTPKPLVFGPQTAIVTGPPGEVIFTDKFGRVKVQFHWDREGKNDDKSSCWIRVSQAWAGRNFGAIHLPRIGQEVIVDFLEGDPDRPIITGRVYNGTNGVPYDLPANATQSGIKSRSVKGSGSNEFRFEDKQGSEEIFTHAQKDLTTVVENDEARTVHNNRTTTIDVDETKTVKGKVTETVMGTETRKVIGDVSETFAANEDRTIAGSQTEMIAGSLTQTVAGGITVTTPGAMSITAAAGFSVVAPGGTRYVDNFFDKTGGKNFQAYGMSLSINGMTTSIVAGLALNLINNKIDITSMKVDITGSTFKNKPTELKTAGEVIAVGMLNLHYCGMIGFM